jgi:hypothetical protein
VILIFWERHLARARLCIEQDGEITIGPNVIEKRRRQFSWTSELDSLLEQDIGPDFLVSEQQLIGFRDVLDGPGRLAGIGPESWGDAKALYVSPTMDSNEEQRLINLAGRKNVRFIAQRLHRSPRIEAT